MRISFSDRLLTADDMRAEALIRWYIEQCRRYEISSFHISLEAVRVDTHQETDAENAVQEDW